jgi:hypothetical protein
MNTFDQAYLAMNLSRILAAQGRYINATRQATRARYLFSSVNDEHMGEQCDSLIYGYKLAIVENASNALLAANESFHKDEYELAYEKALLAQDMYDFIGDLERKEKASLLADNLRDILGIDDSMNQTIESEASLLDTAIEKISNTDQVVLIIIGGTLIMSVLLGFAAMLFWFMGRKKGRVPKLEVDSLHKVNYEPEEKRVEKPRILGSQKTTSFERYQTSKGEEREVSVSYDEPASFNRKIPKIEKYRVSKEEGASSSGFISSSPSERLFESPKVQRSRFTFTDEREEVKSKLPRNKGIMKAVTCRLGLCIKGKD